MGRKYKAQPLTDSALAQMVAAPSQFNAPTPLPSVAGATATPDFQVSGKLAGAVVGSMLTTQIGKAAWDTAKEFWEGDQDFDRNAYIEAVRQAGGNDDAVRAVIDSHNADAAATVVQNLKDTQERQRLLSEAGDTGTGAMLLAGVLDPVNYIPYGGLAARALKAARVSSTLAHLAAGAAVGVAAGGLGVAAQMEQNPNMTGDEAGAAALYQAGLLAGLGGVEAGLASKAAVHVADPVQDAVMRTSAQMDGAIPKDLPKPDPALDAAANPVMRNVPRINPDTGVPLTERQLRKANSAEARRIAAEKKAAAEAPQEAPQVPAEQTAPAVPEEEPDMVATAKQVGEQYNYTPSKSQQLWSATMGKYTEGAGGRILSNSQGPLAKYTAANIMPDAAGRVAGSTNASVAAYGMRSQWDTAHSYLYMQTAKEAAMDPLEFNRAIMLGASERDLGRATTGLPAAVNKYLNNLKELSQHINNQVIRRGVFGAKDMAGGSLYHITRSWNYAKMLEAERSIGADGVRALISKGMRYAIPDATDQAIKSMADAVYNRFSRVGGPSRSRLDAFTADEVHSALVANGVSEKDAEGVVSRFRDQTAERGRAGMYRNRIPLDLSVEHNGVQLVDLLNQDVPNMQRNYFHRAAGDAGLATLGWKSPAQIAELRKGLEDEMRATPGIDKDTIADSMKQFDYGIQAIQGNLQYEETPIIDLLSHWSGATALGGMGFASLAESGSVLAQRLMSTFAKQSVDMGEALRTVRKGKLNMKDLLAVAALVRTEAMPVARPLAGRINNMMQESSGITNRIKAGLMHVGELNEVVSLNRKVVEWQTGLAASAITTRLDATIRDGIDAAGALTAKDMERLGITQADLDIIKPHIDKTYDVNGVQIPDVESWPLAAQDRYLNIVRKESARAVTGMMDGEVPRWLLQSKAGQIVGALMRYPIVATEKNLRAGMTYFQASEAAFIGAQTLMATLVYMAKARIYAYGRPDEDKMLKNKFSPHAIVTGALTYNGYSGVLGNVFSFLSPDGQPRNDAFVTSGLSSVSKAVVASGKAVNGTVAPGNALAAWAQTLPFSRTIPAVLLTNQLREKNPTPADMAIEQPQ